MRRLALGVLCLIFLSFGAARAESPELQKLAWLGGCWRAEGAEPGSGEHWTPLAGGSLLGLSRTVQRGETVAFEFMRIAKAKDGKIAYFAQPSGRPAVRFDLRALSPSEVVFENLKHDFPQRVIYQLASPTRLEARIEGRRKGKLERIGFPMDRVSCDALLKAR